MLTELARHVWRGLVFKSKHTKINIISNWQMDKTSCIFKELMKNKILIIGVCLSKISSRFTIIGDFLSKHSVISRII